MNTKPDKEFLNLMSKNPDNWKGIFYFNRKDPRLIVPKFYSSMGWTLNFANIYAYLFLIAIVLIIIASEYFL
jgi:uncharacterized membrane protein